MGKNGFQGHFWFSQGKKKHCIPLPGPFGQWRYNFRLNLGGALLSVFFFSIKTKSARESHFCPFFRFSSRVEKLFHGHFFRFFPVFFTGRRQIFTGVISRVDRFFSRFFTVFHGHNMLFWGIFTKSLNKKNQVIHGHFSCFTGRLFEIFHGHRFFFHGWNLAKIFTGTIFRSRALFWQKPRFFHWSVFFFTGKKHWFIW